MQVHEMMHALVMHSSLFPYFIDSSLEPRQGVTTRQEKGQSYAQYGVTTPAVLAAYREHTSCQSLDAVPLEVSAPSS